MSVPDQAGTVSPAADGVLSPEQSGPFRLLAMAPYNGSLMWPALNPEPETPTALARAANPSAETASGAAQDPPAPAPPAQPTTPPAPPIPTDDRPAAAPTRPEATAPSEPSAPEPQPSPATAPASGAPPAASPAPAQVPAATADQGLLAATPQSIYASPPPVAAPRAAGRFLELAAPGWQGRAGPLIPAPARQVPYDIKERFAMRAAGLDRANDSVRSLCHCRQGAQETLHLDDLVRELEGLVPWCGLRQVQEEPSSLVLS